MSRPTSADVIAEIRRLAEQNPEFVYGHSDDTACCYMRNDPETQTMVPDCIVGQALWNTGIINAQHFPAEGTPAHRVLSVFDVPKISPYDYQWIRMVQVRQDLGWAWGQCVADVDTMYPEVSANAGSS